MCPTVNVPPWQIVAPSKSLLNPKIKTFYPLTLINFKTKEKASVAQSCWGFCSRKMGRKEENIEGCSCWYLAGFGFCPHKFSI